MHDIRMVRADPAAFDAALARRGLPAMSAELLQIDEKHREALVESEGWREARNKVSKEFGIAKAQGDEARAKSIRETMAQAAVNLAEREVEERKRELRDTLESLPNLLDPSGGFVTGRNRIRQPRMSLPPRVKV